METTVLLEEPQTLEAGILRDYIATAKDEAERHRPGITMFTDGSRLDSGATGYQLFGRTANAGLASKAIWATTRRLMMQGVLPLQGLWKQCEAEDNLEKVTIFTDAQAAIRRIASDEPFPNQVYAI